MSQYTLNTDLNCLSCKSNRKTLAKFNFLGLISAIKEQNDKNKCVNSYSNNVLLYFELIRSINILSICSQKSNFYSDSDAKRPADDELASVSLICSSSVIVSVL